MAGFVRKKAFHRKSEEGLLGYITIFMGKSRATWVAEWSIVFTVKNEYWKMWETGV